MSYSYNSVPIISGAYLVNGANNTTNELYHLPIFGSISSVNDMGFGNEDNAYYVLPGYKLEIYPNTNFGGTLSQTINKTLLYLENDKIINSKKNTITTKLDIPDKNINFEQLSRLNN
jgi:hypothetical protein